MGGHAAESVTLVTVDDGYVRNDRRRGDEFVAGVRIDDLLEIRSVFQIIAADETKNRNKRKIVDSSLES